MHYVAVSEHESVGGKHEPGAGTALTIIFLPNLNVYDCRTDAGDGAHNGARVGVKQFGVGIRRSNCGMERLCFFSK